MARFHYKHYALLLLTVVAVLNYLDRGVLALAMESIKAEFDLSDSQLGLMSGFAFSLFYAVAGLPIARWADRGNRNHVVSLTAALWSAMLVLSGLVGSFTQLLLVRVGIAVGESGCVPSAQSLISDYFNRVERPKAMALYWLCVPIATLLSYAGGGWLIEQLGWRMTFMVIGLPGVVIAVVVKFTLREPRLNQQHKIAVIQPSIKEVKTTLWQVRSFRHIVLNYSTAFLFSVGLGAWIPAFFMRSYGMDTVELGAWMGITIGAGGLLFTYLGGYLATRYAPGKESVQMKGVAVLIVLCMVFQILCCLSTHKILSLLLFSVVFAVLVPMTSAPMYAAIQSLVEERMRAVALAFIFMFSHLIGAGLGPMAVGIISDLLEPSFGQESLRYALLIFSPGFLWCAFHAWKAADTVEEDIRALEEKTALSRAKLDTAQPENSAALSTQSAPVSTAG